MMQRNECCEWLLLDLYSRPLFVESQYSTSPDPFTQSVPSIAITMFRNATLRQDPLEMHDSVS